MIIPSNRLAPWRGNVGVPGGIPQRSTIYKNIVTEMGADPTGTRDCSIILQRAVDRCPRGQVVYLSEGRFRLNTLIHISRSGCTIRGAGIGKTIIFGGMNNPIFTVGDGSWPPPEEDSNNWVRIASGATKGSHVIIVDDASRFVVGAPMAIAPNPLPSWSHNLSGFPDTLRSVRVYFKVRSILDNVITFDPPCPFDFSQFNPTALADSSPYIQVVGLEGMTLDMANNSTEMPIWFQQAWGCWTKEIEITHALTRQMRWDMVTRCEVRRCCTRDVRGSGPNHEGIAFEYASWNLVEDNICDNGGAPPIILAENVTSSACNVAGYNYIVNTDPSFWDMSFSHGSGSILNLAEGNVINNFEDDGYYGSSSYNTLFRNHIAGQLRLKHFSTYYNIVGNILGGPWANTYETDQPDYWSKNISPIYELGYPNIGNASYAGKFGPTTPPNYSRLPNTLEKCQQLDLNVQATLLRHGNWDTVSNNMIWDSKIADRIIPNSLYYIDKPVWWPQELNWPPINPPMVSQIPAQLRYIKTKLS